MKLQHILLFVLILFGACKKKQIQLTDEELEFVDILSEIHLAEAIQLSYPSEDRDSIYAFLMSEIYERHEVDSVYIIHELTRLQSQPRVLDSMYKLVLLKANEELSH